MVIGRQCAGRAVRLWSLHGVEEGVDEYRERAGTFSRESLYIHSVMVRARYGI